MIELYNPVVSVTQFLSPDNVSYRPMPKDGIPVEGLGIYLANKHEDDAKVGPCEDGRLELDFGKINYLNSPMKVKSYVMGDYPPGTRFKITSVGEFYDSLSKDISKPMGWKEVQAFYDSAKPELEDINQRIIDECGQHFGLKRGFETTRTLSTIIAFNYAKRLYDRADSCAMKEAHSKAPNGFEEDLYSAVWNEPLKKKCMPFQNFGIGTAYLFAMNQGRNQPELKGIAFINSKNSKDEFMQSLNDYIYLKLN
jgi:hypothetical protein